MSYPSRGNSSKNLSNIWKRNRNLGGEPIPDIPFRLYLWSAWSSLPDTQKRNPGPSGNPMPKKYGIEKNFNISGILVVNFSSIPGTILGIWQAYHFMRLAEVMSSAQFISMPLFLAICRRISLNGWWITLLPLCTIQQINSKEFWRPKSLWTTCTLDFEISFEMLTHKKQQKGWFRGWLTLLPYLTRKNQGIMSKSYWIRTSSDLYGVLSIENWQKILRE